MTSLIQPSKVDWDVVDEELDKVSEEFKDPRFDSLRHVLDILSAVDAEAALEEVSLQPAWKPSCIVILSCPICFELKLFMCIQEGPFAT